MNKATHSRLLKLEANALAARGARPCHRIIASSLEEAEDKQAALIASGDASDGDDFIYRIITGVRRSPDGVVQ